MRTLPPAPIRIRNSRASEAANIVVGTVRSAWVIEALASAFVTTLPRELKVMVVAPAGKIVAVTFADPSLAFSSRQLPRHAVA